MAGYRILSRRESRRAASQFALSGLPRPPPWHTSGAPATGTGIAHSNTPSNRSRGLHFREDLFKNPWFHGHYKLDVRPPCAYSALDEPRTSGGSRPAPPVGDPAAGDIARQTARHDSFRSNYGSGRPTIHRSAPWLREHDHRRVSHGLRLGAATQNRLARAGTSTGAVRTIPGHSAGIRCCGGSLGCCPIASLTVAYA